MTWGLMILVLNLGYLSLSVGVGIALYVLLKKKDSFTKAKRVSFSMLLSLVIFLSPFYDLLIQKAIKTYYETFKMEVVIYAYPEKDENGRIESLGVGENVYRRTIDYLATEKDFIEYYFYGSFEKRTNKKAEIVYKTRYKPDLGYARVYFNKNPISYEKIKNKTKFKARYQVFGKTEKNAFYTKKMIQFLDTKKSILMAKGIEINFPTKNEKNKFRYKHLLWQSANGVGVGIRGIDNISMVFRKLFNFYR